jgi:3'(2'), 5'-bisphosphate nucleotidase
LYFGWEKGAHFLSDKSPQELIELSKDIAALSKHGDALPSVSYADGLTRIVASRSHNTPETDEFIQQTQKSRGKVELVSMGSSLKICLVAHGKADLYPRFAPTMEWDTAAGQAIAEASGKSFINYATGKRMHYNRENLRNDWFLVS